MRLSIAALALGAALATATVAPPAFAQSVPYWGSEQEERLKEVDGQILDLQRQRFQAIFAKEPDQEAVKRLDKQFRELQKERRKLLEATGQL
ncbi:MAG: hypothetical protein A3J75_06090 [Acidobacteria bacterium RBG_16_68_9]|nr:MAG: hypothetical protein A3J75_06090 [Acidobacteria bacterium RBG_16_68_9]